MPTERITFPGHSGTALAARLDMPDGPYLATALFAHCFTCGKDIAAARRISSRLASIGIAVLRFDFTGLGHSEGEFENTSFTSNVQDLIAAGQYLAGRNMAPSLLIGHSLGGAAVLRARAGIPSVQAVATIGSPVDPAHVAHLFSDQIEDIRDKGQADVVLAGRTFQIGVEFVEDICQAALDDAIASLKAALLVLHAQDAGAGASAKIDQFHRRITLLGDLNEDQRARLLEIADKCPVHRTLELTAGVVTELV